MGYVILLVPLLFIGGGALIGVLTFGHRKQTPTEAQSRLEREELERERARRAAVAKLDAEEAAAAGE